MTSELEYYKYSSSKTFFWITLGVVLTIVILGYVETRPNIDVVFPVTALAIAIASVVYLKLSNSYLEIKDGRTLVNRGYRELGHDVLDIYDIKYIYRLPQFSFRGAGTIMVIYLCGEDGKLKHSIVREVNYSDKNLKRFLTKITQINPNVDIDPEYLKFLARPDEVDDNFKFSDTSTRNTKESIESMLHAKGESW